MDSTDLMIRYDSLVSIRDRAIKRNEILRAQLQSALDQLTKVNEEYRILENSVQALKDVKPLLSVHSIEQCEKLANAALSAIFNTDAKLYYDSEDCRFKINEGDFSTDLVRGNGGGYIAVISFVFNIFLLMKLNKRLFLAFDEHFTQISSVNNYFFNFFEFLNQLVKDLNIDILLITQDDRISEEMVDRIYFMENGTANRKK
jgi:hypothetical protein